MPFENAPPAPKSHRRKVAVIGAGISGMGAAYMLSETSDVTLFEAENRIGGHARTRMAGPNMDQPVDTGFIVFNYANYPHMAQLFDELDVPVVKSNMSFGASIGGGRFEYALASLNGLFAQRKNALNPKFLGMIRDIFRFNKNALRVAQDRSLSVGDFLKVLGTGDYFRDYYLLPLSGAIWSTPTQKIMDFPAHAMIQFFENHALLGATGQHQWYTVEGGSIEYVRRLEAAMLGRGVDIQLSAPIQSVQRIDSGVRIKAQGVDWAEFDDVVFATHSDDTLAILGDDAGAGERAALGSIKYQPNDIVLHSDESIMPHRRATWSSWVYTEDATVQDDTIDLTYWMNSLQPIKLDQNFFVTLNTKRHIDPDLIYDQVTLRHPVYDAAALAAQDAVRAMNGDNNTWFCGAWMRHGFHEDGLDSAVNVVRAMQARDTLALAAE
ncbi:hypothetical protein ASD8599_03621 [Ascidiaceihabitans donghaensis]|uniref:Amine oxidase domain-containing protein n=1 Tax=Ascidiaceihabitans donghaensis TaxID=1510460 RepID=A0A2R8BIE4_9RHOB|nr:FAD-dependent oxidoreductase [Ascidiaceihabitans donghaensis]SPH22874.1 hypothetical protein ASD8599_03621 [Ascidiaceihabitans donghaensis]